MAERSYTRSAMIQAGIIELDVHGKRTEEAIFCIDKEIEKANKSVYRIRVIHGFHGGTRIRDAILEEYSYQRNSKVLRVQPGINQGITELILREL